LVEADNYHSMHHFTVRRVSAVLLAAALIIPAGPYAAQRKGDDAYDFSMFLQSVASRRTARTCERGVPGYDKRFDEVYPQWEKKYRDRISRGESLFQEALTQKDRPSTDRAMLEQVEKAVIELAESSRETGPLTLNDQAKSVCDEILAELEEGLEQ
jgi:hypothetical protein